MLFCLAVVPRRNLCRADDDDDDKDDGEADDEWLMNDEVMNE